MTIRVYMRDGRTVYRLKKRSELGELIRRQPENETRSVLAEAAHWNPMVGELSEFREVRLRYIAKGSIAWVEEEPRA